MIRPFSTLMSTLLTNWSRLASVKVRGLMWKQSCLHGQIMAIIRRVNLDKCDCVAAVFGLLKDGGLKDEC